MATVNKTYDSNFRGVSVSPDGKQISVSIGWTPRSADAKKADPSKQPTSFASIRITGGKVFANNVEVGSAPEELAQLGTSLASKAVALVESLINTAKITP
jgi:hypothetical protein